MSFFEKFPKIKKEHKQKEKIAHFGVLKFCPYVVPILKLFERHHLVMNKFRYYVFISVVLYFGTFTIDEKFCSKLFLSTLSFTQCMLMLFTDKFRLNSEATHNLTIFA